MRWLVLSFLMISLSASSQAVKCASCGPYEWRLDTGVWVPPSNYVFVHNPPCDPELVGTASQMIADEIDKAIPGSGEYIGPIIDPYVDGFIQRYAPRGEFGEIFATYADRNYSMCVTLMMRLPPDAEVYDHRFRWVDCDEFADTCPIGWSTFEGAPVVERTRQSTIVWTVFKNWTELRGGRYVHWYIYFRSRYLGE
jgi:hypothetical protein